MHLIAHRTSIAASAASCILSCLAGAATHTWTGDSPTSNKWSDQLNWSGSSIPPSSDTSDVVFSSAGLNGGSNPNSLQDLASLTLRTLSFSLPGTGSFSLAGGGILLGGAQFISQNSAADVTVSNDLGLAATSVSYNMELQGDGTGLLTLGGEINTFSFGLRKRGTSTVLFTGPTTFRFFTVEGGTARNSAQQTVSRTATIASSTIAAAKYRLESATFSTGMGTTIGGTGPGTFDHTAGNHMGAGITIDSGGAYNLSGGTMSGQALVKSNGSFVETAGSAALSIVTVESGGRVDISGGTFSSGNCSVGQAGGSTASFNVTGSGSAELSGLTLGATGTLEVRNGGKATLGSGHSDPSSSILLSDTAGGGTALSVGTTSGPHSFTFSGVIGNGSGGAGGINCVGVGQTIFHGINTYTGTTNVSTGLIAGNGRIAGPVNLTSGATISPGNFIPVFPGTTSAGIFQIGALSMVQGTSYVVQLNGPSAGQHDTLQVAGAVSLGNATLAIELAYNATPGQTFTIIDVAGGAANPITGQFANAPDNSVVQLGGPNPTSGSHYYYVDYQGGDGNDLTITSLDPLVASRQSHGELGSFDAPLSIVDPPGTESRSGGPATAFTLVFTFADPLVSVGNAQVTAGTATVSSHGVGTDPHVYVVSLTGVNNLQRVRVTLSDVSDSAGHSFSSVSSIVRVLLGDTNGDGTVNAGDATQTRARSGQSLDATNFRSDVNRDGSINSGDAVVVKARSGNTVP